MYVDPTNALSKYYSIIVEEVDLSTSGLETVTFRFA
jgi:hypothetical protein